MEGLGRLRVKFWNGKNVLVTGHSGFKGAWLAYWLTRMGANVTGIALKPETSPNLFDTLEISQRIKSHFLDIRDLDSLRQRVQDTHPEIVIHMAAQALVRPSYEKPLETFATNVMGTANVLEVCRGLKNLKAIVNVTTDKVYENKETERGYSETDSLGGHDPYSSSKACSEIVTESFRKSFLEKEGIEVVTARSGNVIGGGDWSRDRILPDAVRSFQERQALEIRNPKSVRPWQHVLDPLCGYLTLAEAAFEGRDNLPRHFNFGPDQEGYRNVSDLSDLFCDLWGDGVSWKVSSQDNQPHEAGLLYLDTALAKNFLKWSPKLSIHDSVSMTVEWYRNFLNQGDLIALSDSQIQRYEELL